MPARTSILGHNTALSLQHHKHSDSMKQSEAFQPRTSSSNTHRFQKSNHGAGRRQRPALLPRLLASFLILGSMRIWFCNVGGRVLAHDKDRFTQSSPSLSNVNDRAGQRRRSYGQPLRILNNDRLCSQVTNAEESNELQVPCDCVVGDFRNILKGGLFKDKGNHENTTGQEQKRFWHQLLTFTNSPGIGATPDAKPRCESVVSRSFRSLSSSRVPETCLQIQRGGANRFVNEDGNKFGNKSNNDEIIGSNAYDSNRNRMRLDETKSASKGLRKHSPVVYQYFGRSRSRGGQSHPSQADDAPLNFILLGPNVDHWKTVGQTLASRGFNVMACERMVERQQRKSGGTDGGGNEAHEGSRNYEDAPELVLEILDALKWDKAVLVGCDDESSLAMESAMMLAPDRVAGLILCGDLTAANRFAEETGGVRVLDTFLYRVLDCPFVIVWDGGARSIVSGSSAHEAIETKSSPFDGEGVDGRCVILGGGSAPHRTKPEYFAWVLARFVEEKLESHSMDYVGGKQRSSISDSSSMEDKDPLKPRQNRSGILQNLNLPFGIDSLVSPEGRLLLGRAVAAAIFYTSAMKVAFVQYGILRMWLISIKNSVDSVDALRRKVFQVTGAFIWNLGYIPRLFKFSPRKTKELDEDGISGGNSETAFGDSLEVEEEEEEENGKNNSDAPSTDEDENGADDGRKEDEDDESEDTFRMKPLFFLDNIFT